MIVLRRTYRAAYGQWWRAMPLALPMSRAMVPVLIALTPLMIRVGAEAAFIVAMMNIVFGTMGLRSQLKRNKIKNGWFPWEP